MTKHSENIVNTLLELLHQHHNDSTVINTITIFQGILSSDWSVLLSADVALYGVH